jgi:type III secretory pathway component EscR
MNIKLIVDELYPIRKILNIKENFNGNVKCPSGLHGDKGISMDSLYQELLLKYSEKELKEYFNHFMKDKESKQEKKEIKKERNEDFISFTMRFFNGN